MSVSSPPTTPLGPNWIYAYYIQETSRYPEDRWAGEWLFYRVDALWIMAFYQGGP